jgi:NAD(P)-dependent dehydrogenase (short-subunit alcohol dehydrogenase family)
MKLQGKVAVITGGTTGIGQAAARLFHAQGAQVFLTGRNETTLAEVRKALPGVSVLPSDAANLEDVAALARTLKAQAGRVDVLFVNAGIAQFMPIDQVTPDVSIASSTSTCAAHSSPSSTCFPSCLRAAPSC